MVCAYDMSDRAVYFVHASLNVGFAEFRKIDIPAVSTVL